MSKQSDVYDRVQQKLAEGIQLCEAYTVVSNETQIARKLLSGMCSKEKAMRAKHAKPLSAVPSSDSTATVPVTTPCQPRNLDTFRQEFDKSVVIPQKITKALSSMGDGWLHEAEFCRYAHVSPMDLRLFVSAFARFRVEVRKDHFVWAGTEQLAERMRACV